MIRRPPISPLFPYTTLSRSAGSRRSVLRGRTRSRSLGERVQDVDRPPDIQSLPEPARTPRPRADAQALRVVTRVESRSEEHTSELQSQSNLVCRLLLEKTKN